MNPQKAHQLLRTDILLKTELNCYVSLIPSCLKTKIVMDRAIPICSRCEKPINFSFDNYLNDKTDDFACLSCYKIEDYKTHTKYYACNLHCRDHLTKKADF
jgi:hypothetical protein